MLVSHCVFCVGSAGAAKTPIELFSASLCVKDWTHVVGTFDGDKASIYVNASKEASRTGISFSRNKGAGLRVGAGWHSNGENVGRST